MLNLGLVGVGKMGLSHLAILRPNPRVKSVVVCDPSGYVRDVLEKYSGLSTFDDSRALMDTKGLDGVVIATPSRLHAKMVRDALDRGLHVFCEKPFCLDPNDSKQLAALAISKQIVNQVGYHYRFVGTFNEAKRLLEADALGRIHHVRVEAYGPVVLRAKGGTWRMRPSEGGGCLYDYACHAVDLVNYLVGAPKYVTGASLNRIFSADVDDEVYATLHFENGATGQLAANWSDESFRRMSTEITIWGTNGRMIVDRQEIKTYIRDPAVASAPVAKGWSVRNITELTPQVDFYLRGEEYSSQIEHFIDCITNGNTENRSSFSSSAITDSVVDLIRRTAEDETQRPLGAAESAARNRSKPRSSSLWGRAKAILT
jgi:scyllo-inositol 2-dehydrogenase (NADP+)